MYILRLTNVDRLCIIHIFFGKIYLRNKKIEVDKPKLVSRYTYRELYYIYKEGEKKRREKKKGRMKKNKIKLY